MLGIDEHFFTRRKGFATTLCDLKTHSIYDVVLGRSDCYLDACREHQMIHVRQYERWGVLFVPAYLFCSLALWFLGKRPYYDNPFEREAFVESCRPTEGAYCVADGA